MARAARAIGVELREHAMELLAIADLLDPPVKQRRRRRTAISKALTELDEARRERLRTLSSLHPTERELDDREVVYTTEEPQAKAS